MLAFLLAVVYAASSDRSRDPWRTVIIGLAVQTAFAVLVLRWSVGKDAPIRSEAQAQGAVRLHQRGDRRRCSAALWREQAGYDIRVVGADGDQLPGRAGRAGVRPAVIQLIVEFVGGAICVADAHHEVASPYAATSSSSGKPRRRRSSRPTCGQPTSTVRFAVMTAGLRVRGGLVTGRLRTLGAPRPNLLAATVMIAPAALDDRPVDDARDRGVRGRRRPAAAASSSSESANAIYATALGALNGGGMRGDRRMPADRVHLAGSRARGRSARRRRRAVRLRRPDVPAGAGPGASHPAQG